MKEVSDRIRCSVVKEERGKLFAVITVGGEVSTSDFHWQGTSVPYSNCLAHTACLLLMLR